MKFNLYKELLDERNIMSHVFMNCANESLSEIADKNKFLTEEEIKNREIDIELKIDGKETDPRKFFNSFWEQYEEHIRKEIKKIFKEQTSDKFREMQYKIQHLEDICDYLSNDINFDIKPEDLLK